MVVSKRRNLLQKMGIGLAVGLAFAWMGLIGYAERHWSGQRLWLVEATYDAGQVRAGEAVRHRVWVFNPTLVGYALRKEVTCGCTVAEVPSQLSPLSGFMLDVVVDTSGRSAGRHVQRVYLIVQDGRFSWREVVEVRYEVVAVSEQSTDRRERS